MATSHEAATMAVAPLQHEPTLNRQLWVSWAVGRVLRFRETWGTNAQLFRLAFSLKLPSFTPVFRKRNVEP
eukprot:scaffold75066_cov30-Phaeocystis_antarctica.AAC.1